MRSDENISLDPQGGPRNAHSAICPYEHQPEHMKGNQQPSTLSYGSSCIWLALQHGHA